MQNPQRSPGSLEQLLLAELENNWQEVDELIRGQEPAAPPSAIIRDIRPKRYIWSRLFRYCKKIAASLYRLCKIDYGY